MKILITGASGLLGRAIYKTFSKSLEWTVYGTAFTRPHDDLIQVDLTDSHAVESLILNIKPDLIIHAAAERKPDVSRQNPEGTLRLNVKATHQLAELAKAHNAWLIYISTDYVFDGSAPPYYPHSQPNPLNFYGKSKRDGEKAIRETTDKATILRVPILYGPVEFLGEDAISTIAFNMTKTDKPLLIDNWAIRYPTHVEDVAFVLRDMVRIRITNSNLHSTFHWSGNETFTKFTMGLIIAEVIGIPNSSLCHADTPVDATPRPKNCQMDTTQLKELGINHQRPFKQSIANILSKLI